MLSAVSSRLRFGIDLLYAPQIRFRWQTQVAAVRELKTIKTDFCVLRASGLSVSSGRTCKASLSSGAGDRGNCRREDETSWFERRL